VPAPSDNATDDLWSQLTLDELHKINDFRFHQRRRLEREGLAPGEAHLIVEAEVEHTIKTMVDRKGTNE